jgi:hypothetical protein
MDIRMVQFKVHFLDILLKGRYDESQFFEDWITLKTEDREGCY